MWLMAMFVAPLIPAVILLCSDYAGKRIRELRRHGR